MFKCCVCQGKSSRRTSQEDDEDDSSREMDEEDDDSSSSSSSSSSSDESSDEVEQQQQQRENGIEKEKKSKCQSNAPSAREANVVGGTIRESDEDEDEDDEEDDGNDENTREVVVEVNGDARPQKIATSAVAATEDDEAAVDRNAVKEDIVDILHCAVKIVTEIRRSETEKLEKIKEELQEESTTTTTKDDKPAAVNGDSVVNGNGHAEDDADDNDKTTTATKKPASDDTDDDVASDDEGEYEVKNEADEDAEPSFAKNQIMQEKIMEEFVNELNEESDNAQELKEIVGATNGGDGGDQSHNESTTEKKSNDSSLSTETPPPPFSKVEIVDGIKKRSSSEAIGTKEQRISTKGAESETESSEEQPPPPPPLAAHDSRSGDHLLNIPPPATPPPEDYADDYSSAKFDDSSNTELSFPTPPPIDFEEQPPPPDNNQQHHHVGVPQVTSAAADDNEDSGEEQLNFNLATPPPLPPWDDDIPPAPEQHQQARLENYHLPVLGHHHRQDWKVPSPGSKSLPSPPSPGGSETGCETEAESKSSEDEQSSRVKPTKSSRPLCLSAAKKAAATALYVNEQQQQQQRSIDADAADDEGDDSVFEAASLVKDPEIIKDLPPRPGCEHDEREEHLEELVNRLENVTKRLEQVSAVQGSPIITAAAAAAAAAAAVQTSEIAVQTKSPSPERSLSLAEDTSQSSSSSRDSTVSGCSVVEVVKNMSLAAYEDIVAGPLHDYLQLSQKIGGDVASHAKLVEKAFQIQLQFLRTAASRPAPSSQSEQVALLAPTSQQIQAIQEFREKHRGSAFFNHLSAVSESIPALGWVAVAPTPAPYVKEMNDAGQFYTNRVLKDWKEKDKTHVEWCKVWVKTLTDLQQFIRQHHTTGLVWAKTGSVPPPPSAGGVPPPPPPCMMPMADPAPVIGDDRSALFAEINQGEKITKNLKKVTSDMQTHKNPNLRTGPAPFKAPVVNNNSTGKPSAPVDKPPVFSRDGKKWLVEYHKGNQNLVIDNTEMNNVVYMFCCQNSNLVVKGKINSVVMDSCRKCSVVVDSVVASIEFVNCQSVQMQVLGKVPTISIDKTDGCQMYLNNDTLNVELITSKSSEMNIMVPVENNDYAEYAVPEQFKTVITKRGLQTTALDSLG
ncbi:probable serine/threonine-protein kinase kinX isoform X3 [Trichogramma pretiosum]|uniref:probable serine/threonine-protein kinase kinX isoform X3 n=1 Tax=Trichogramma pretiosum TaxID=7493 RepID=UPI0006C980C2|nr:probable serine/threonine-protein kinase kinX isoform X3 [Trichogramma pretiosum]